VYSVSVFLRVFPPDDASGSTKGGVLAIANLRGGIEYFEEWHKGGNLTHKQNSMILPLALST
jgi:hypothetical protein